MYVKVQRRCDYGDLWFDSKCFLCIEQVMNLRSCDHWFSKLYLSTGDGYLVFEICDTPKSVIDSLTS